MSRNDRMIPRTVPKRPTNGASAPIVPTAHRRRFMRSAKRCRSRSAARFTDWPGRFSLLSAAMKISATGEELRSHTVRAACRSPWYNAFPTSALRSRAPWTSRQKLNNCSRARATTRNVPTAVKNRARGGIPKTSAGASGVMLVLLLSDSWRRPPEEGSDAPDPGSGAPSSAGLPTVSPGYNGPRLGANPTPAHARADKGHPVLERRCSGMEKARRPGAEGPFRPRPVTAVSHSLFLEITGP